MAAAAIHIIKRSGKSERYDTAKLTRSIKAATSSVGLPDGVASDIATKTIAAIDAWLGNKTEITSDDIRRRAADVIRQFSAEASYLYQSQKEIV